MSNAVLVGLSFWMLATSMYLFTCLATVVIDHKIPKWTYPGIAVWSCAVLILDGAVVYAMGSALLYLFKGLLSLM